MNKAELINEVASQTGLTKRTSGKAVDAVVSAMANPCPERKKSF